MIAIYPGSFDPVTNGHTDIIKRAARVADTLIVAVMDNANKQSLFTLDERAAQLTEATDGLPGVRVLSCRGSIVDLFCQMGADVIIRGVRDVSDYENELKYAACYRSLDKNIETLFIPANPEHLHISSSLIKEAARFRLDVSSMTSQSIAEAVKQKINENTSGGN